ncbi:hypothetical protein CJ030_MR4G021095 [Morella rubra]|uniref:Uncharacterized protein n=1 Tax=Morella rubra TaxID=262757 RepID=A0A6A1VYU3_9ROSI|nr:hypothetical protein CJ030_MR4G021095 [Morella rubra]
MQIFFVFLLVSVTPCTISFGHLGNLRFSSKELAVFNPNFSAYHPRPRCLYAVRSSSSNFFARFPLGNLGFRSKASNEDEEEKDDNDEENDREDESLSGRFRSLDEL